MPCHRRPTAGGVGGVALVSVVRSLRRAPSSAVSAVLSHRRRRACRKIHQRGRSRPLQRRESSSRVDHHARRVPIPGKSLAQPPSTPSRTAPHPQRRPPTQDPPRWTIEVAATTRIVQRGGSQRLGHASFGQAAGTAALKPQPRRPQPRAVLALTPRHCCKIHQRGRSRSLQRRESSSGVDHNAWAACKPAKSLAQPPSTPSRPVDIPGSQNRRCRVDRATHLPGHKMRHMSWD